MFSASTVPRKLKNVSEVFHHNKDDYTDTVKQEVTVNKIDTQNLFKHEKQEEIRMESSRVGKLKLGENIFEKNSEDDQTSKKSPEIRVGKLDSDKMFKSKTEDEEVKPSIYVGKLDKNVYNIKSSDEIKEPINEVRVGKINTENLFQKAEENSEELLNICKPGKLSEDKLQLSSNLGKIKSIYITC